MGRSSQDDRVVMNKGLEIKAQFSLLIYVLSLDFTEWPQKS